MSVPLDNLMMDYPLTLTHCFLFLQEPPVERVPIPDFRTVGNLHGGHPSRDRRQAVKHEQSG